VSRNTDVSRAIAKCMARNLTIHYTIYQLNTQSIKTLSISERHHSNSHLETEGETFSPGTCALCTVEAQHITWSGM